MLVQNKKTYDYIVDNFPESLIAKSINDLKLEEIRQKLVVRTCMKKIVNIEKVRLNQQESN